MKRTVLVDTGPLYAALDPDDQYHGRAQMEIRQLNHGGFVVLVLYPTLQEAYSLVLYRLGIRVAHTWLKEVANSAVLMQPSSDDYENALQLLPRFQDQPITLFDAVMATVSRRLDTPVWSYDHHFDVLRTEVWRD